MLKQTSKDQLNKQTGKIHSRALLIKLPRCSVCPEPKQSPTLEQKESLGCRLGCISHPSLHCPGHPTVVLCVSSLFWHFQTWFSFTLLQTFLWNFQNFPNWIFKKFKNIKVLKLIFLIKAEVKKAFIQHLTFSCALCHRAPTPFSSRPKFPLSLNSFHTWKFSFLILFFFNPPGQTIHISYSQWRWVAYLEVQKIVVLELMHFKTRDLKKEKPGKYRFGHEIAVLFVESNLCHF